MGRKYDGWRGLPKMTDDGVMMQRIGNTGPIFQSMQIGIASAPAVALFSPLLTPLEALTRELTISSLSVDEAVEGMFRDWYEFVIHDARLLARAYDDRHLHLQMVLPLCLDRQTDTLYGVIADPNFLVRSPRLYEKLGPICYSGIAFMREKYQGAHDRWDDPGNQKVRSDRMWVSYLHGMARLHSEGSVRTEVSPEESLKWMQEVMRSTYYFEKPRVSNFEAKDWKERNKS